MKEKLKNLFSNKMYLRFAMIFAGMVIAVLIIIIISAIANRKISFEQAETRIKDAAINYFEDNEDKLPEIGATTMVELSTLVDEEYIYNLSSKLEDTTSACGGHVKVYNNNGNYLYTPSITCGDTYKSTTLKEEILNNNEIVTSNNGLYSYNSYYLFKGDSVNNYIEFDGELYRIVKIDNSYIRMIQTSSKISSSWDDRYNYERESDTGINNYETSRLKETLDNTYSDLDENVKKYLLPQNICIGKQAENSSTLDGSVECRTTYPNQYLSVLQVNEYALASADKNCNSLDDKTCKNYNYLADNYDRAWSITGVKDSTHEAFRIYRYTNAETTSNELTLYLTINIPSDLLYEEGNGTESNPYVFKN